MKKKESGATRSLFFAKEEEDMAGGSVVDRIEAIIKQPVESLGLALWDVKYVKEGASWYLRVFIDKPEGVDINDCTDVSHLLDPILDEHDIIKDSYYFEVCSPGLERELSKPEHFEFALGKQIKVILIRPLEGVKEFCGTLESFDKETVKIAAEQSMVFKRQDITKVKLFDL